MPECDGCGTHVTTAYKRTLSDENGVLYSCNECRGKQKPHHAPPGEANGDRVVPGSEASNAPQLGRARDEFETRPNWTAFTEAMDELGTRSVSSDD